MTTVDNKTMDAETAWAQRQAYFASLADAHIAQLEALRARLAGGTERDDLDSLIAQRRRAAKASLEDLSVVSDLYDKSALPLAAALPVLLTLVASERLLIDSVRTWSLISAYLVGGAMWALCRWLAFLYAKKARNSAAMLGKVD